MTSGKNKRPSIRASHLLLFLLIFTALLVLAGCAHTGSTGDTVYGIWKLANYDEFESLSQKAGGNIDGFDCFGDHIPTEFALYKDGTFAFTCNNDGNKQGNGTYSINDNILSLSPRGSIIGEKSFDSEFTGDTLLITGSAGVFNFVYYRYDGTGATGETSVNIKGKTTQATLELSGNESKVAGTYKNANTTYVFAKDGTMRINHDSLVTLGSYSADEEVVEIALNGVAKKYNYTLSKDALILYEPGDSTGTVYKKTTDGQKTAGLKENKAKNLSGIFSEQSSNSMMFSFSMNGICRISASNQTAHGTYSITGNTLTLVYDEVTEKYIFEIDNDLIIFPYSEILTSGVLCSNVTTEYENRDQIYETALESFESGNYDEAAKKFASIPGYFDSDTMVNESQYQRARQLYDAGNYEDALSLFSSLSSSNSWSNYKDSKDWKDSCQRALDLKKIQKILFKFVSKESEAFLNGGRPYSKPTMEFKFGLEIVNASNEDITAISMKMTLKDGNDTFLTSFNVSGNVSIKAGNADKITITHTLKDYSSVTINDVSAHLMDAEDFTVDIELVSLTLSGRTINNLSDKRRVQTAVKKPASKNILGEYVVNEDLYDNTIRTITFNNDGSVDCIVCSNEYSAAYRGSYFTNGYALSINFDSYLGVDNMVFDEYCSSFFPVDDFNSASEFRLVNDLLFIRLSNYSDVGGLICERVQGEHSDDMPNPNGSQSNNGQVDDSSADMYNGQDDSQGIIKILVDGLRIRLSPSTSAEITALSIKGDEYLVYETYSKEGYTWYKIGPGQWIADKNGDYASYNPYAFYGADESSPIGSLEVLVNALRIRRAPNTTGEEKAKTEMGDKYRVYETATGEGYTWYRIGRDAWIADKEGTYVTYTQHIPDCSQIVCLDVYENNGMYSAELSVKEWGLTGWFNRLSDIPAAIGSNGTTLNKREGDHCTPSGTFNILFCFSDQALETNLRQKYITEGDVWVTDQSSRYYNTIQPDSASYKDWSKSESIYRQFTSGRSYAGILFDYNGDGESADSATPGAGAALFLDGIGSGGNLYTGYGDIKVSESDMKRLLKVLDQSLNPTIIIRDAG